MKNKLLLVSVPFLALGTAAVLSACGKKYDVTLTVYNWADYIYTGADEDGTIIDKEGGVTKRFEKYYEEKTGKSIKL